MERQVPYLSPFLSSLLFYGAIKNKVGGMVGRWVGDLHLSWSGGAYPILEKRVSGKILSTQLISMYMCSCGNRPAVPIDRRSRVSD
jgi:hypothetical protein